MNSEARIFFMRAKRKRAEVTKTCAPLKCSLTSSGQNNIGWSQVTILSFWPPRSYLAEIEENGSCFTKLAFKALLPVSLWVCVDSVESSD